MSEGGAAAHRRRERSRTGPPRRGGLRIAGVLGGAAMVVAGLALVAGPLIGLWMRSRTDQSALNAWRAGGAQAIVGCAGHSPAARGGGRCPLVANAPQHCGGGAAASDAFAFVSFPSLARYGYAGVAGDGGWDLLHERSMVHYRGSAGPGELGNDVIAFHREPEYEHIDQLRPGDVVEVQDRSCHTFTYRIGSRLELPPDRVTQLEPTQGHDLTLITCAPWFRDYDRFVWRASLVE